MNSASVYLKASICGKAVELCRLCVEILVACKAGESFGHNPESFSDLQIHAGVCRRRRGVLQGARHKEGHRVVVLRGLAWKGGINRRHLEYSLLCSCSILFLGRSCKQTTFKSSLGCAFLPNYKKYKKRQFVVSSAFMFQGLPFRQMWDHQNPVNFYFYFYLLGVCRQGKITYQVSKGSCLIHLLFIFIQWWATLAQGYLSYNLFCFGWFLLTKVVKYNMGLLLPFQALLRWSLALLLRYRQFLRKFNFFLARKKFILDFIIADFWMELKDKHRAGHKQ